MKAMVLERVRHPLVARELPEPAPGRGQVRLRVEACGVCRTDLHVQDGDLAEPELPLVLGHEIVGVVEAVGGDVAHLRVGQRVGVPWLGSSCGRCPYCRSERENLCDAPGFTGYTLAGGFAEQCLADARYTFPLPGDRDPALSAPLLCAGLIGFRSYRMAGAARNLGLYGFGAAAHLLCQLAVHEGRRVFAFTRPGDRAGQDFARRLGALWAGDSDVLPPEPLDAALLFAPVGALVPAALRATAKGGSVICGGIHMSDIPSFAYADLWQERVIRSVANLTRADGHEYLARVARVPLQVSVQRYALADAQRAMDALRAGDVTGAAVLIP